MQPDFLDGPLAAAPRERESQFDFLATTGLNCERAPRAAYSDRPPKSRRTIPVEAQ